MSCYLREATSTDDSGGKCVVPWGAQDASRHVPSPGTGWDICGLGGDGPGVWMALAQRGMEGLFFFFLLGHQTAVRKCWELLRS